MYLFLFIDQQYTYFFEDDLLPAVEEKQSTSTVDSGLDVPSASLLLDNVSKIEREYLFLFHKLNRFSDFKA